MSELNFTRLRDLLDYDQEIGKFTWKVNVSNTKVGNTAGSLDKNGYIIIGIQRKRYKAHRLAWLYSNGVWPSGDIDHINGKRDDNRLQNLRSVTRSVNIQNRRRPVASNPFLGVSWNKQKKRWKSEITVDGKRKFLGYYKTPEAANEAYVAAKRELHPGCTI